MSLGATLVASLLVTLARPATWPLGLATFLLRGGFLLVLAPIVVLPSAVALGNVVTPVLSTMVFQGLTTPTALLLAAAGVAALLWLFGAGFVAAAAESELVRRVATDDETWAPGRPPAGLVPAARPAWRVLAVRLIAHLPFVFAATWATTRVVTVTYRELTVPSDVEVALALRVAVGAVDAVAAVVVAWLLGETIGALAARRVILLGEGIPMALRGAVGRLVRYPWRCLVLGAIPIVPLALLLVVVGWAGSATWDALRAALSFGSGWLVTLVLVTALVASFTGGLLLIGVASAWRAGVWTVEVAGTFGVIGHGPEGQWMGGADSGRLNDLRPRVVDHGPEVIDVLEDDRLRRL